MQILNTVCLLIRLFAQLLTLALFCPVLCYTCNLLLLNTWCWKNTFDGIKLNGRPKLNPIFRCCAKLDYAEHVFRWNRMYHRWCLQSLCCVGYDLCFGSLHRSLDQILFFLVLERIDGSSKSPSPESVPKEETVVKLSKSQRKRVSDLKLVGAHLYPTIQYVAPSYLLLLLEV